MGAGLSVNTDDDTIVQRGDGAIIRKRPPIISISIPSGWTMKKCSSKANND